MKNSQTVSPIGIKTLVFFLVFVTAPVFGQIAGDHFSNWIKRSDKGDSKGAIAEYTKAIELDPDHYLAYFNRAIEKKKLGNHSGAIRDFSKSISIKPHYNAYYGRAKSKEAMNDHQGAIMDFTKAIEFNSNHLGSYYDRGIINLIIGNSERGRSDLEKAKEILGKL